MIGDGHRARLLAMVRASQQLSRNSDEKEVIATFVRCALSIASAHCVRLVSTDGESFLVECEAWWSPDDEIVVSHRRPVAESEDSFKTILQTVSLTDMPVLLGTPFIDQTDVQASPRAYVPERPLLCVPLFDDGRRREILFLEGNRHTPQFDASLIACLQIISAQTIMKLENLRCRTRDAVESSMIEEVKFAMRAHEKELAHTQRMSQTGSWRWYAGADTVEASPEFFRIYEVPSEQRVPSKKFIDLTHPDDSAPVRVALHKAIAAHRVFKLEFRITVGFGEIKYVQIEGHPQVDDIEGAQYVGVVVDVTERRNAESALQAARAELARAHRLSMMGEMAASIVHEIYQPLTGIITNAEACLRWLSKSPAEIGRASDSARRVARDARRAAEVFRGLRAVASNSGIVKVPVDLDDAIREVAFLLQGELDRANIRLRLQSDAPRPVLGDRTQIQQVLENLIRNSMDALQPVVGTQRFLTVSSASYDDAFAVVTVQDNGCGFGEHSPEELFEALFTTKPNGMGMGLKVCRSIVEAHGGVLHANRKDDDTVFQFTLPFIDSTSGADGIRS